MNDIPVNDLSALDPFVRFCSAVSLYSPYPELLMAYDFRLFYVLEGGFKVYFETESIVVRERGLLVFPPATPYRLEPLESSGAKHIILDFDLVSERRGLPSKHPVSIADFNNEEVYSFRTVPPFDTVFFLENAYFCIDDLNEMCEEMQNGEEGYTSMLSGMLRCLLVRAAREKRRRRSALRSTAEATCIEVKAYIRERCVGDIDNVCIGEHFGYHPYYLNQIFKRSTGYTLREYITECRLYQAQELLLLSELSIAEIGERCGFCSSSYFTEVFSGRLGVTPREYRKNAK
ncbi:MAG: helix-turn-helix transcriptional regulator [Clostridia bacterium]|nr:helix-turn-helix transcriptional regulator [Clostridia bacterium]